MSDTPEANETEVKEENIVENEESTKTEEKVEEVIDNLSDIEKAEIEIKTLKVDLAEAKSSELRTKAEMMNFRKRLEKEKSTWNQMTIKDIVSSMLDPLDNLDRSIEAAEGSEGYEDNSALKGLSEGVKMVLMQFNEMLERKNVKSIDPKGELFNPNEHEAYGQIETDEVEEGHVAAVFRKGFKIGDLLVRTATVQIAKKAIPTEDAEVKD